MTSTQLFGVNGTQDAACNGPADSRQQFTRETTSARALPCVRNASALRTRCFPHELQEELDAFLAKPFLALTTFALLDRLERLERAGTPGATAKQLAGYAEARTRCSLERVAQLLERARRARKVSTGEGGVFLLTGSGRQAVRAGRATRLALFRLRTAATPSYACGVVDFEEQRDEDEDEPEPMEDPFDPGHPMDPTNPLQLRAARSCIPSRVSPGGQARHA